VIQKEKQFVLVFIFAVSVLCNIWFTL